MPEAARAEIDRNFCVGSGACEMEDPAYFSVGDDGVATVTGEAGRLDLPRLIQIADGCPARAIRIVDAVGEQIWNP